jgi:hypothetical protein
VKTPEAEAYQAAAALVVKAARPSWWKWQGGMVVAEYRFFIRIDADCTNLIKTVEDAVFPALGINDSYALPRAMSKVVGVPKGEERVEVDIYLEERGTT